MKTAKTLRTKPARKLTLNRETVQQLADGNLQAALGGCAGTNNCTDGVNCQMF